ncbi:hypothetical protein D9M72_442040 [compost metagenome]
MVEGIALGGDPRHFGRFAQQRFVVGQPRRGVLALEARHQQADQFGAVGHRQRAVALQLPQQRLRARRQRIDGTAGNAADRGAEAFAEALRMEFADEELGNVLGRVGVRVRAPGHADAVQRIRAVEHVAQRPQDAGKSGLAFGQRAVVAPFDRAQRAVVEGDLAAGSGDIVGVGAAARHALEDAAEQHHVQGLGDFRAAGTALRGLRQIRGQGDQREQLRGAGGADVGGKERGEFGGHGRKQVSTGWQPGWRRSARQDRGAPMARTSAHCAQRCACGARPR